MIRRPIVGFIVSPLFAPLIIGIFLRLNGHQNVHEGFWLTGSAFSYFIMLIVGLPIHFALRAMKLQKWFIYCVAGGAVGLVFAWYGGVELVFVKGVVLFACAGAFSGLMWWLFAVRGFGR